MTDSKRNTITWIAFLTLCFAIVTAAYLQRMEFVIVAAIAAAVVVAWPGGGNDAQKKTKRDDVRRPPYGFS